jgi:hypothetical protein
MNDVFRVTLVSPLFAVNSKLVQRSSSNCSVHTSDVVDRLSAMVGQTVFINAAITWGEPSSVRCVSGCVRVSTLVIRLPPGCPMLTQHR